MYKLIFDKKALHQLNKLPSEIKERIWNKLQKSKESPHRFFEKLVETKGCKLRIGDYRVVADIVKNKLIILVLKVGHRKNVYEK